MRSPNCFTRLVVDNGQDIEIAELGTAIERIQSAVRCAVPREHQMAIGRALLDLAIDRMLSSEAQRSAYS